jgi:hypothetical protein
MYHLVLSQAKLSDTLYIKSESFGQMDLGPGHDFSIDVESGNCAVKDDKGERHFMILRQRQSYQKDWLDGWDGRRYFIPGKKVSFLARTERIS